MDYKIRVCGRTISSFRYYPNILLLNDYSDTAQTKTLNLEQRPLIQYDVEH